MDRTEKAIFTNLCMIYDDGGNILVQDRKDPSWPGICFPGGHVEPGESFTEAVIREVREETGLAIQNPMLCGVKQFQTKENARYVVFLYKANQFSGELRSSDEGEVYWVNKKDLPKYDTVDDFPDMMKVMESDDLSEFYYFENGGKCGLKLF